MPSNNRRHLNVLSAIFVSAAMSLTPMAVHAAGGSGGGMTAPSTENIDPSKAFQEGVDALQEGDYKTADRRFKLVLDVVPDHPEANYYRGLAKIGLEKEQSSVRYFKRAIKARSNFVEARERLAIVYVGLDKSDKAAEQLSALEGIAADCTSESCDQAFIDRTQAAIAAVTAALEGGVEVSFDLEKQLLFAGLGASEAGVALYDGAVRLIHQGRYEEAIAELAQANRIFGPHADIYNYLGYSHRQLGKMDAAQSYYSVALKLDPNHLGAREYLGELYLELGDLSAARRQLRALDERCAFGCAEREQLARLIGLKEAERLATKQ